MRKFEWKEEKPFEYETIDTLINGENDRVKTYVNFLTGEINVGIQWDGQKHDDYKDNDYDLSCKLDFKKFM